MTTMTLLTDMEVKVPRLTYNTIECSPRLVRTMDYLPEGYETAQPGRADFYDTLVVAVRMTPAELMKTGRYWSPPTEGEEQAVYTRESAGATALRDAEGLRDYFGNNDREWYAWGHTLTGLRFQRQYIGKSYHIGEEVPVQIIETDITPFISQINDASFKREDFRDIMRSADKVVGERTLQYCISQIIEEMDIFGLWKKIRQTKEHSELFALRGSLPENLDILKDPLLGTYDVAVVRECGKPLGVGWLSVGANDGRLAAASDVGFRPVVRGSLPEL